MTNYDDDDDDDDDDGDDGDDDVDGYVPSGRGESTQPPVASTDQSDEDEVTVMGQGYVH